MTTEKTDYLQLAGILESKKRYSIAQDILGIVISLLVISNLS